jgi:hypothetical protein
VIGGIAVVGRAVCVRVDGELGEEMGCSGADGAVSGGLSGGTGWNASVKDVVGGGSAGNGPLPFDGFRLCVVCLRRAAMAAFRSTGHTDARTWKGT